MGSFEDAVRDEACDIIGTELPDEVWDKIFEAAKGKLRHIVELYGDAGGARNAVEYMAQIAVECARAMAWQFETAMRYKKMETGTKAGPQGHTTILPQKAPFRQVQI